MEIWQCVIWLCAITLEVAHSQSPDQEEQIRAALGLYNQKEGGEFLFKLLSDLPAPLLQDGEDSPAVSFLIKETECLKSEDNNLAQCDYKKDGEVKICGLYTEEEEEETSEILKCVSLTENSRGERSKKKKKCKGYRCRPVGFSSPISRRINDSENIYLPFGV
uniref:Cathelicidin family antimicrobial peptide OL-CATH1 n=1 Tax=Odorrana livida TaxID=121160 RepID=A0A346P8R9_ODOLI|nr:cathelicidin family antimicrobial peptide OL-CATH1 [Odorrana livida]